MTENKLESAQKGFEQIIKRYKRNLDWSDSKSKRDEETINFLREKNREMDKEIREFKKALSLFQEFSKMLNQINL
jgi:DNA-binding ferritin-like protein